jgi:hypothetical protein
VLCCVQRKTGNPGVFAIAKTPHMAAGSARPRNGSGRYFAFAFIALTGAAVGFAASGFFASFLGFFASLAGFDAPFAMGVDLHHHEWRCEVKREA